jgi:predicted NAD/FAD-dependent oxidoreductase
MRTVVVGAGLSGLVAARQRTLAGDDVTVIDKGDVVGGRLSTTGFAGATFDVGAQFFTVRSEAFAAMVDSWIRAGVAYEWCRGFSDPPDGYPRYVAHGGMAAIAAHLADGLDVRLQSMCFSVRRAAGHWQVGLDDGSSFPADALVLTCPVPQSASLLLTAEVPVPEPLRRTDYFRTIAVLAALDGPSAVPAPGGVQLEEGVFSFVADNQQKGISDRPALTLHVAHDPSTTHWGADRDQLLETLMAAARRWIGAAEVREARLRRWRFAGPVTPWPEACWTAEGGPPVVLAGDAFAGPKVEGAALSGAAAASALG